MKKYNKNEYNRKGVTLIVLAITILIMLIIASVITINTKESLNNAKIISFAEEVKMLEDASKAYYLLNGEIPKTEDSFEFDFKGLMNIKYKNVEKLDLKDDIYFNHDEDSKFYKLDLIKLDVQKLTRGLGNHGEQDFYYISYPNLKVYYIRGVEINKINYYSLSNKITKLNILDEKNNELNKDDVIKVSPKIHVTKSVKYTTNLNVNIDVNMSNGDTLYMSICSEPSEISNKKIITKAGNNHFNFDKVSDIFKGKTNISFDGPNTLTEKEVRMIEGTYIGNNTYTKEGREKDRYIYLSKYDLNNKLIEKVKIDLNNFSNIGPKIISSNVEERNNENLYNLILEKGDSDIQEIKYEYITKTDEYGIVENYYYKKDDVDFEYILKNGKKGIVTDNKCLIKTNKEISKIKLIIVDKAGNFVSKEMKTQDIPLEVGKVIPYYKEWNNPDINATYVKNGKNFAVIPVPKGFTLSKLEGEYDINDGIVIYEGESPVTYDSAFERNQYVWVPVDGIDVKYERIDWKKGNAPQGGELKSGNLNEKYLPGITEKEDKKSVEKYRGFYIGRYEVGIGENANNVVQKLKEPVGDFSPGESQLEALPNINLINVKSGMITGTRWDTTLKYISLKDSKYPLDSNGKGNDSGNVQLTGSNENYKLNNIYDMAGNVSECTNENGINFECYRGGNFSMQSLIAAGLRCSIFDGVISGQMGIRNSIYIK